MITKIKLLEYVKNLNYQDVDEYLIDEFIYNLKLQIQAKKEIKDKGLLLNVSTNPNKPYYQQNQAISIYNSCVKNILNISKKIGLSAFDRQMLKIKVSNNIDDGFDDED